MAIKQQPKLALPQQPAKPAPVPTTPIANTASNIVPPPPKRKGGFIKKFFVFLFLIVVFGGIAAGAYYYFNFVDSSEPVVENLETGEVSDSSTFYDLKITSIEEEELADFEVVVGESKMHFRPKVFYIDFN